MTRTTIFRVTFDANRYQQFGYDLSEPEIDLLFFNGEPRKATWAPQPVYVHHPRLKRPDIWRLAGAGLLTFEKETANRLEPFLSSAGELLSLTVSGGGKAFALNITQDVDCLDVEASILGPVQWRLSFLPHRLPASGLFKVPQCDTLNLYLERDTEPDSFRHRIDSNNLVGIDFEKIWTSSGGATDFSLLRV